MDDVPVFRAPPAQLAVITACTSRCTWMLLADLVDLGEGEPADLPDDPAEHQLLLEGGVVRLQAPIISLL